MEKKKLNLENAYANNTADWCILCITCIVEGAWILLTGLILLGKDEQI